MYLNIKLCEIHSWLTNFMEQISSLEVACVHPELGKSSPYAHISIIFTWTPRSAKWFLSFKFSTKTFPNFHPTPLTCSAGLTRFCCVTQIIFVEEWDLEIFHCTISYSSIYLAFLRLSYFQQLFPERLLFSVNCRTNLHNHTKQRPLS
jgi:hypothetical protein